ncbi:class I SAM-dependent methyltransferase [Cohnella panacarvi]|uniref:class I SAM-dependent methyltransferase n=1 Tax=Cohnella panacarvi TaxID=400776 RepID=UPI000479B382|nr:class I SAM-dependent methyltransferase [Cohnella panacarvi]
MNLRKTLMDMIFSRFENSKKPDYIVIYGAGQNGLLLMQYLMSANIEVNYFCDNSPSKQGTLIRGIPCLSIEQLCSHKDNALVFVSPYHSEDMMKDLERLQFSHVISSDVLRLLRFVPQSKNENTYQRFPYIGHFYSLYPDIDEIMEKSESIFDPTKQVLDIDLNEETQLTLLREMINLYPSLPQWEDISVELGSTPLRHRLGNTSLSASDAVGLHCMLRLLKPNKMIEVGSGYTSAVTLDTNEFFLDNRVQLTFIEPYPDLLKSILKPTDRISLIDRGLQDVPLEVFEQLDSGDILFIDSTHVSKVNSDVNYLFFEILPRLKKGVYIHLHDIFYPFEYPKKWIMDGLIWNELYLLRAFLLNNSAYSIQYFQNMMDHKHMDLFLEKWPYDLPVQGGSIWLRKNEK